MPTLQPKLRISPGPSRHVYDVIVLGGQLGGAMAAALLSKRGYRVLLVEHDGMGPGYEHSGFVLPYAPFIAPPLKAMPKVEEAFAELGLNTTVQRSLRPHTPDLQLVLPRHRLDLHTDEAKRQSELTREFGKAGVEINTLLKLTAAQHERTDAFFKDLPELPPDGMMASWQLKKQIHKHPEVEAAPVMAGDDPIPQLLSRLLPFVTFLANPSGLSRTRTLSQVLHTSTRYPGGREGIRELLCLRLSELGGDLLWRESTSSSVVESLTFDGDKWVGLKVLQSDNVYRASCLIIATDSAAVRRLVAEKRKHRRLMEALDLATTKAFLFTVNWVVKPEALPIGMGDLILYDTQEEDLGPLVVQLHNGRMAGSKSDDDSTRVVCAAARVPSTARDLGEPHLKVLADRIAGHLSRLMPFAREQLILSSAPYLDASGARGARLLPHPLFEIEAETLLGVSGVPQRTPVKNILFANREVLPGLGFEGELLAGIRTARLVKETLKKKDPLKR